MTARIERGEDETDSEFALDERMGAATDVAEVSVVVGFVLERFPDVAAGLFETDLNVVVPPVRELDLVPSWWVVKSASNPVCPTSSSIGSITILYILALRRQPLYRGNKCAIFCKYSYVRSNYFNLVGK